MHGAVDTPFVYSQASVLGVSSICHSRHFKLRSSGDAFGEMPRSSKRNDCYLFPRTRYSDPGSQISGWKSSERKCAGLAPLL